MPTEIQIVACRIGNRRSMESNHNYDYLSILRCDIADVVIGSGLYANARQRRRIHEKGEELRKAVMSQMRVTMLENVVLQFFAGLGSAVSVAIAAWQCARGNMAAVNLVYALFLIGACFGPMTMLINAWHFGYRGVVASYTIVEMLSEPVRMSLTQHASPRAEPVVSEAFIGHIRFDGVTFAYASGSLRAIACGGRAGWPSLLILAAYAAAFMLAANVVIVRRKNL